MFDLSKQEISIDCPRCHSKIKVTLGQVAKQQPIKCNRCSSNNLVTDQNESVKKGVDNINKGLKNFESRLKKYGY